MLKETYETTEGTRDIKILSRAEQTQIIQFADKYIEGYSKALYTIHGLPGTGKTYLVKNVLEIAENNHPEVFCAYLDVSDCIDESEVYYRIALQLEKYYVQSERTNKNYFKKEIQNTDRLIQIYEWVTGKYRNNTDVAKTSAKLSVDIAEYINEMMQRLMGENEKLEDSSALANLLEDTLVGLSKIVPVVGDVKRGIEILTSVRENDAQRKFKQLLYEKIDILDNRALREDYLLDELIKALPENTKRIIVLDNFQLNQNNELGRNYTWLTSQNKMMNKVDALWMVVSRMPAGELFEDLFQPECRAEQELNGFSTALARKYLIKNCFDYSIEQNYDFIEDFEQKLIDKMLEVADFQHGRENNDYYLPYLLRMVVLYYWKLKETPNLIVTPEMFLKLGTEEDFVGYYFYKDLSDLMVNAFQILSCLSVWDDVWIATVQRKIDNHLLNARNLLEHKAPIETVSSDSFKLHEALRESLYINRQNYIKKDVLKHLYETFISIYEGNEAKENKGVWYDLKRLQAFVEIVFAYLDLDKEKQKENLRATRKAMEKIYQSQQNRGTVSEAFIRLYCFYIDKIKTVHNICFVDVLNNEFQNEKSKMFDYRDIPNGEQDDVVYYMDCCFKLADLYTNFNQNGTAWHLEQLCVSFWDKQMHGMERENRQNDADGQVWYYRCWQQKVKALNAMAYDYSAEHKYESAYQFGKEGIKETEKLGNKLIGILGPEQAEMLQIILNPEASEMFAVNGAYTEVPDELSNRLLSAYAEIWQMKLDGNTDQKQDTIDKAQIQKLKGILAEVLLKNQQDLRGNFPWYCLENKKNADDHLEQETNRRKECVLYGVRTYWMRRSMYDSFQNSDLKKDNSILKDITVRMLKSYHNICVYLSKNGEFEKACLLAKEVLEESQKIMPKGSPNQKAEKFIADITSSKKCEDLLGYLWQTQHLTKETGIDFFSKPANIIEQMEYLGDFYLHMHYYIFALKWLSPVMLMRGASLERLDSKTLDTILRFYIVVYAEQNKEAVLFQKTEEFITQNIIIQDFMKTLDESKKANGLLQKLQKLEKLIAIGKKNENIENKLAEMISEIDKK